MTHARELLEYAFELEAATVSPPPRPVAGAGRKRWRLRSSPHRGRLQHSGLPKLVAHVLENRGIGTNSEAQRFLGGRETGFGDPSLLPGFEIALHLLNDA
ncbi:MAG TPA: hypothetical protein VFY10_04135, partial [Dehalococcoidia bacterium]|nr:hypothetical protein [Dehalococcoidia bacterium]